jgi:CheY-like chemotaxis protein
MSRRILLAENHADSREVTSLILSQSGFEVVAVPTGYDVLALAEKSPFDLVVLDQWLPDISGIELCRKFMSPTLTCL